MQGTHSLVFGLVTDFKHRAIYQQIKISEHIFDQDWEAKPSLVAEKGGERGIMCELALPLSVSLTPSLYLAAFISSPKFKAGFEP